MNPRDPLVGFRRPDLSPTRDLNSEPCVACREDTEVFSHLSPSDHRAVAPAEIRLACSLPRDGATAPPGARRPQAQVGGCLLRVLF